MQPTEAPGRWGAFSYGAYRRFWLATVARVFGLQFRFIGVGWLVVSQDGLDLSPIWLGIVGLAVLILADAVTVWLLIAWAITVGTLTALSTPAQSAILPRLIDMRAMPSAVAFTSSVWNTMRILGPAGAGVLIAVIGIGQAFFVTAAGFALSALLVASLRLEPLVRDPQRGSEGMLDGLRYVFRHRVFLGTIGLSFFTSVFGMSYQTLLPVFADDILSAGSQGYGFMQAAAGVGGFCGTLAMIRIGASRHAGPVMLAAAAVFGLFIAGFAGSRSLELSLGLLFCAGFSSAMYLNIGMTVLQVQVPDELRGRVMGVWSMTWFLASIGGLPASALAEWIGAPLAVALGALSVTAFAALLFMVSSELRRLPMPGGEIAAGAAAGGR